MTGIIVTGHGNFASSMPSSLNLIVGSSEGYKFVDFDGNRIDVVKRNIKKAISKTNIPILIDVVLSSQSNDDINEFAKHATTIGSDMILVYEQQTIECESNKENGI